MRSARMLSLPLRSPALGLFLSLCVATALVGCEQSREVGPASPDYPDQEVRSFTLTQSVEGKREWRMTAASAATYRDRGVIIAKDVALDFFDEEGQVYSHLTSREGEIESATNNMVARGNVVVTTRNGTRIETEILHYIDNPRRIVSDVLVTVTRGGDVLSGIGFESDPSLETFEFRERVRARVQSEPRADEPPGDGP